MGGRTKIWDIIGLQKESFYVFQRTKTTALVVFHQTNSVSETIRILGYPTRRQLYTWIAAENMVKREYKQLPRFTNPPEHPRNPPLDVMRLDVALNKARI